MNKDSVKASDSQMHSDHQQWLSEDALWHDELKIWEKETQEARGDVERINQALARHSIVLENYGGSLCLSEDAMAAHEHALAGSQQGRIHLDTQASKFVHGQEGNRQSQRRARHQELRGQHYRVLSLLRLLSKALSE